MSQLGNYGTYVDICVTEPGLYESVKVEPRLGEYTDYMERQGFRCLSCFQILQILYFVSIVNG